MSSNDRAQIETQQQALDYAAQAANQALTEGVSQAIVPRMLMGGSRPTRAIAPFKLIGPSARRALLPAFKASIAAV